MASRKFKPCPFCGSSRSRIIKYDGDTFRSCVQCGASTACLCSAREANAAWERRPGDRQYINAKGCPKCHGLRIRWRSGVGFENEMRCADCSHVWEPT